MHDVSGDTVEGNPPKRNWTSFWSLLVLQGQNAFLLSFLTSHCVRHYVVSFLDSDSSSFKSVDLDIHDDRMEDFADDTALHAKPRGASVTSVSDRCKINTREIIIFFSFFVEQSITFTVFLQQIIVQVTGIVVFCVIVHVVYEDL